MYTTIINITARNAFFLDILTVIIICLLTRGITRTTENDSSNSNNLIKLVTPNLAVLIFISILVTFWTREAITSVIYAKKMGVFPVWIDFFYMLKKLLIYETTRFLMVNHSFWPTPNSFCIIERVMRYPRYFLGLVM